MENGQLIDVLLEESLLKINYNQGLIQIIQDCKMIETLGFRINENI